MKPTATAPVVEAIEPAAAKTWDRSSALVQTVIVGLVFMLVFSSYFMMQGYAALLFGPSLASASLVALYAVFSAFCFVAPGCVNRWGGKKTLALGVAGYGLFASAALAYAALGEPEWSKYLVIVAGGCNGAGAAMLWTAQGRLLLDCAARDPAYETGNLFAIFWALFNLSAVFGGFVTFFYFSNTSSSGNAPLYMVFVVLIALGGLGCSLLDADAPSSEAVPSPLVEARATLALFRTKRALLLAPLFWYTGYNQPYQLDGFGDRFFQEKIVGLELAAFYGAEVIGGFVAGKCLDDGPGPARRRAKRLLAQFALVTALGYVIGFFLEKDAGPKPDAAGLSSTAVLAPSLTFLCWGFSDSQVQTYVYWLVGELHPRDAEARTRVVGLYKLVQSLGWCCGFALLPRSRMGYLAQLLATGACFVLGTALALCELPAKQETAGEEGLLAGEGSAIA